MQLTTAEEQVMRYIWKLERAYMKNILDEFPEPKPATTTVSTLFKRMTLKGFIGFEQHGSNRLYYPLVKKTDYFSSHLKSLINDFFNNSATQFASFFTTETNMSEKELKELRDLVDKQIKSNSKKKMSEPIINYIIRSSVSLVFVYLFFTYFLAGNKMHRFNRFYLIASLVFSFVSPTINHSLIFFPSSLVTNLVMTFPVYRIAIPNYRHLLRTR